MKRLMLVAALSVALALPQNGCRPTPAHASVRGEDVFVVAAGDTLKTTAFYKVTGNPDSVRIVFSVAGAPSVTVSRAAPPNGVALSAGPANLIPSPPIAEGATVTVSSCPTAWKAATSYPGACSTKPYTKPVTPPTVTLDSLTVIGLDVYPKGTYATTRASGACIRAIGPSMSTGWSPVWDYASQTWKPVCRGANGKLMMLAYCGAPIMGDSVRVLTASWTTKPWCAQYTPQVPRRYVPPPGLLSKRQQAADKVATSFIARTSGGVPQAGWVWDDVSNMIAVRDSLTPDTSVPAYMVGFMTTRNPPGGGAFARPDSAVFLKVLVYNGDGTPRAGVPVTFTPGPNSGSVAGRALSPVEEQLRLGLRGS